MANAPNVCRRFIPPTIPRGPRATAGDKIAAPFMTSLRRLSAATAAATLALVAIGGLVRATGSGDACPDWPRCFGSWLPPFEAHALIEYSHRLAAVAAGLLILVTAWVAWRREREPAVLWPILAAVVVVIVQAGIGRVRIVGGPQAIVVTIHFLVAITLVALVMITATAARLRRPGPREPDASDPAFRTAIVWTLATTAALLLVGAYVRGEGAGLVFLDWPLMDGRIIPDLSTTATAAAFVHRALAALGVAMGALLAFRARNARHPGLRILAWTAFGLLLMQAAIGAAAVLTQLSPVSVAAHVTGGSLAWASLVALGTAAFWLAPRGQAVPRRGARETVGAYLQLMKPDIIVLLLVTTVPAMVLAARGMPRWNLVVATLLGGVLTAGGANAINCYADRDIDQIMARTRRRPIPSHRVEPESALRFGAGAVSAGFLWLWSTVNLVSAALAVGAAAFYVLVYTLWMKRSTPQNIVIGGAAGAVPALVGWAAVTGRVEVPALVLFAIVFFWTPPHFWALALRHAGEYARAGVPMLPVVRGTRETALHILYYSLQLFAVSLLLFPAARMGPVYLGTAVILGAILVGHAVRVLRDTSNRAAMALFRYSITYLGLLFAAVATDALLQG
jgi:protoheme IX farnesyltransferase